MLIDDFPVSIDDEHVRNHLNAKGTLELAVRVEQDGLERPLMLIDQRLNLIDVLCLVDGDGNQFHARLLLPFFILLTDGVKLTVTRLTPGGKEVDNHRLAIVRQRISPNGLSVNVFQRNRRYLRFYLTHCTQQCCGTNNQNLFHKFN